MSVLLIRCADHEDQTSGYPAIPVRLAPVFRPLLVTVSVSINSVISLSLFRCFPTVCGASGL